MNSPVKAFVPLDFPSAGEAQAMVKRLQPVNPYFKVGLELFTAEGPDFVRKLVADGAEVFLDLKFHDIPNTVAGAVRSAARLGVKYLNVHCGGGKAMLEAAHRALVEETQHLPIPKRPILLGVTVLTSMDDNAVQEVGFPRSASAQVKHFIELAIESGLGGVVCSGSDLPLVRSMAGTDFVTMVPGIRPAQSSADDQSRIMTPRQAVELGANCLVVGRPITKSSDPVAAMREILAEL